MHVLLDLLSTIYARKVNVKREVPVGSFTSYVFFEDERIFVVMDFF